MQEGQGQKGQGQMQEGQGQEQRHLLNRQQGHL